MFLNPTRNTYLESLTQILAKNINLVWIRRQTQYAIGFSGLKNLEDDKIIIVFKSNKKYKFLTSMT